MDTSLVPVLCYIFLVRENIGVLERFAVVGVTKIFRCVDYFCAVYLEDERGR